MPTSGGVRVGMARPGELLVKLSPGAKPVIVATRHGLSLQQAIGHDIYLFTGSTSPATLAKDSQVRWAQPNRELALDLIQTAPAPVLPPRFGAGAGEPNDPLLPAQYGVTITGADKLWGTQPGRPDVVVAVIDSGIDGTHPEFEGQLVGGMDFTVNPPSAESAQHDGYGHGTHIGGVIAARTNNGQGIAGLAPGCKLMPVRIFNDFGHSSEGISAAAVIWASDHGAKVINASWGSPLPGQAAEDSYQYAMSKDVVLVAAVGNSGSNETKSYPGATDGAIGVAATNDIDGWASFSTWGDWVSLAAPGEGILSTFPIALGNGYRIWKGTSMAAPTVSAAAALVRSQFPAMTQAQVKARLEATAKDVIQQGVDPYSGHGRVDIARAVFDRL